MIEAYISQLASGSRIRARFRREKNSILKFVVIFEIQYGGNWVSVLRYDTAHDNCKRWKYPHKHIFSRDGKSVILKLKIKNYNDAFTVSYNEIKKDFRRIKADFLTR